MEGFRSFDWGGDARWQAYQRNLEVPDPKLLERAKARWYKREIVPDFDVDGVSNGASSAPRPSADAAPEPSAESSGGAASDAPAPSQNPQPQAPAGSSFLARLRTSLQKNGGFERVLFMNHILLIILFVAYLQPFNRAISHASYVQFLLVAIISYILKIGLRFGVPRLKPFPAALKSWLAQASATTGLQYAIICSAFTGTRPTMLVCVPTFVLAVYHAFAYASTHFGNTAPWRQFGRPAHSLLMAKQRDAQLLNAGAEIGLGFLTLLKLFTRDRNIMLAFLTWQILRTRFHTPDCAAYHRQVWSMLAERARPLLDSTPVLRTPIGFATRWFTNV